MVTAAVVAAVPLFMPAQPLSRPAPTARPAEKMKPHAQTPKFFFVVGTDGDSEKSIAVDPKVNVALPCVSEGKVKINGWERNEVRVFVKDGSRIGFKVRQRNRQTGAPNWIVISGVEHEPGRRARPNECLWGAEIEIDVPSGAAIDMKGRETATTIDSVRKAVVKNGGGDLSLRSISDGVYALTYEGSVTVENSEGTIYLESTSGNIVAFETGPSEIGDTFKAKTNSGTISLQNLEHRQIEVNSISGAVVFNGTFSSGGLYNFGTSNGSITLALAKDASCIINASYGYGEIKSDLPLKNARYQINTPIKSLTAKLGDGDGTLKLTTTSGRIYLKPQ